MSEEAEEEAGGETREKLDKLIERAEELLAVLKLVSEDLKQLSDSLKPYAQQAAPSAAAPQPAPQAAQPAAQALTVESVQQSFPEDLRNLLSFQEQDEFIVIKPKGFLGSENFARAAEVVKNLGGDYISAGKASHFRVPKQR
jgi:ABC-type transporter Mla subunit MlaD